MGKGKAELGIVISSAVGDAPGTEGEPLAPTDLKSSVTVVVGTMAKAQDAAAANALVVFLASPQAVEVIRHRGFTAP